jgi:hypothetical protein
MFADIREAPRSPVGSGVSGMPGCLRLPRWTHDDRIGHRSAGRASARTNQWPEVFIATVAYVIAGPDGLKAKEQEGWQRITRVHPPA